MLKSKISKIIAVSILAGLPLISLAQAPDPNFNPNKLIEDKVFADTQTFGGAGGIQKFLEIKKSVLANTDPKFLAKLKEPNIAGLKESLGDPEPNLPRLRTAAELIWDASVQSGINPQVILVTLNKEQGLITSANDYSESKLQKALDRAMGFDCPDSAGCGNLFPGFYYQLFGNHDSDNNRYLGAARSLMKSFSALGGRGPVYAGKISRVGDTITLENTLGGYENISAQQTVSISNNATAALYRYTPHVFNGNYNFWKFFISWFRYANGTLLKLAGSSDVYIIQNGLKQLVPQFVATARALNFNTVIVASPSELDSYQSDKIYGPADNTIAKVAGDTKKYVFIDNTKHQASDLVIKQRGLNPDLYYTLTQAESDLFLPGSVLPPKDGTIVRGKTLPAIYLVDGGKIKLFSAYTFGQRKISAKQIIKVPDEEITSYDSNGFVVPLDGSLVKGPSTAAVYLVETGLLKPILADIFKNRGFNIKKVTTLTADEINAMPVGDYAAPKDRTYFALGSKAGPASTDASQGGQQYLYKEGTKHSISAFVAKQRGITPDYVFNADVIAGWADGIPVPPRDNTIIKGSDDTTIYLVQKGQLRPLTAKAFANRKITAKKISTLPQAEVEAYAKGDTVEK
jgi:hypothetical protein